MVVGADPVELGLVASLAHPGGRVTGIAFQTFDVDVKRLQFLREAMPVARRFGYLWPPGPIPVRMVDALTQAARRLNIELTMRSVAALDKVVGDPHLRAREMFVPVRVGDSEIEVFGSPLELSRSPVRTRGVAPTPGQHNREVYVEWLGMSTERFESLRAGCIV
jgi:hypothetical protein